jgi:hypothetical protein
MKPDWRVRNQAESGGRARAQVQTRAEVSSRLGAGTATGASAGLRSANPEVQPNDGFGRHEAGCGAALNERFVAGLRLVRTQRSAP